VNTRVEGEPGSCRNAARALRRVARRADEGSQLARHGSRTPASDFSGSAADAYRARCDLVALTADALGRDSERGARALERFADDLTAVQEVMARVRSAALDHGLLVGVDLVLPGAATPAQERAHDRLIRIAGDALAHLDRARERVTEAFAIKLPRPATPDYAAVLLPPDASGPAPTEPIDFPPPDSAWPDRQAGAGPGPEAADVDRDHAPSPDHDTGTDRQTDGVPDASHPPTAPRDAGPGPGVLTEPPAHRFRHEPYLQLTSSTWHRLPDWVLLPGEDRLP
jgi:hypothetical protein